MLDEWKRNLFKFWVGKGKMKTILLQVTRTKVYPCIRLFYIGSLDILSSNHTFCISFGIS